MNRLCAQYRASSDTFRKFLDFDPTQQGVHGGHLGANLTETDVFGYVAPSGQSKCIFKHN